MQLFRYLLTAAFMAVFGTIYFRNKESGDKKWLVFKALATFMAVLLSAEAAFRTKETAAFLVLAGVGFYMAADVLLEIWFLAGVAFFGMGHICIILTALGSGEGLWYGVAFGFGFSVLMLLVTGRYLKKAGYLVFPGGLYAVLLCFMAGLLVSGAVLNRDIPSLVTGLGGVCFVASDTILGWGYLSGKKKRIHGAVLLILYYAAVYLLAVGKAFE